MKQPPMDMKFKARSQTGAKVNGSTTINHFVRCDLDISLIEYVLLDYYHNNSDPDNQTKDHFRKHLGYDFDDTAIQITIQELTRKAYLIQEKGFYTPTEFWKRYFASSDFFDSVDADNPGIWQIFAASESPRGNKEMAKKAFQKAVKEVDPIVLIEAAKKYIKYCLATGRFSMNVSTWLNPKNRHWEDEYPDVEPKKPKPDESKFNGTFFK